MKKQMSLFVWAVALFGMAPVWAATNSGARAASSADLTGGPATRSNVSVNYEKYPTRSTGKSYTVRDDNNLYYTQPKNRSALYKQYDNSSATKSSQNVRTSRTDIVQRQVKRKYYLAHPFFQPLKGKFGSVTDLAYNMSSYKMNLTPNGAETLFDDGGKWKVSQFAIQEDFSYGILDTLSIHGMLKYDSNKLKLNWNNHDENSIDDSGLNTFGIAAKWRFVDNDKWIAMFAPTFQHQKDMANVFMAELKGGYKISRSTIYGLARGWYWALDGESIGDTMDGINTANGNAMSFVSNKDSDHMTFIEGGIGVFSVLDEDWTLNAEAVFGDYEWHNQMSIRAAIGWQPNDWFALNVYAQTSLYDNANDKKLGFWWMDATTNGWRNVGTAKLDDYSETSVGLQAIFYF